MGIRQGYNIVRMVNQREIHGVEHHQDSIAVCKQKPLNY
jgi:hypothetical protein